MDPTGHDSCERLTAALRAAAQAFLTALEGQAQPVPAPPRVTRAADGQLIEYDPLVDPVPFAADPTSAEPAKRGMATVTYVGALARINASEGRGATTEDVREYALKAGYADARAVSGWADRPGSEDRAIKNIDGLRYVKPDSIAWLHGVAAKLGIKLVGDYTPLTLPEE